MPQFSNSTGTIPQAYLTVLFFDERFNFIAAADGGAVSQQIPGTTGTSGSSVTLPAGTKAPKNGYAYVFLSNRSNQDVYFDNFKVQVTAGNLIEENHYYAYGLNIASISSVKLGDGGEGGLKNNYQYNDKELIDDAGLNWYDYGFRSYDPQIGRFPQLDPLTWKFAPLTPYQYASDEPISNVDMDGLEAAGITTFTGVTQAAADAAADAARLIGTDLVPVVVSTTRTVQATVKVVSTTAKVASKVMSTIANVLQVAIKVEQVGSKIIKSGGDKIANDFYSGNDQTGLITTATPEMRKDQPVHAFFHQLAWNVEDFMGYNGLDNAIANLGTGKLTSAKIGDLTEGVFNAGASIDGEGLGEMGGENMSTLRHYTSNSGLDGIKTDMEIKAYDQNTVFAESANRSPLSASDASDKYKIQKSDARNYVEFQVPTRKVTVTRKNGVIEHTVKGNVKLDPKTTKFVKRR